jgi:NhaP-type Na+/H+ or K+/H+ antiporter
MVLGISNAGCHGDGSGAVFVGVHLGLVLGVGDRQIGEERMEAAEIIFWFFVGMALGWIGAWTTSKREDDNDD